jgi:hypothetical protein
MDGQIIQALIGQTVCGTLIALVMGLFLKTKNNYIMKYLFTITLCLFALGAFAQQKQNQYILIIRSKVNIKASSEVIKTNIQHWTVWMTDLGQHGKIAGGYRFPTDGATLTAADKAAKPTAYVAKGELVSSFLIINATDLFEAKQIAAKCPTFELGGDVEIRAIENTAN